MWIGVADAYGTPISSAAFSHAYQNHGNGWYWVAVGANTWVYVYASGFNTGSLNTDAYQSVMVYLTRSGGGGGTKK